MTTTSGWTPEKRAKASELASKNLTGRPVSDATREKISRAQTAERSHNWRGDAVGYQGAHKRHRKALPKVCEVCGATEGRLDVALRKSAPLEHLRGDIRRKALYSTRTEDYARLCRSCHVHWDNPNPVISPKAREARIRAGTGRPLSPEHRAKIAEGVRRARAAR